MHPSCDFDCVVARLDAQPIRHPHFQATAARLREALRSSRMVLHVGMPGVGKTYLARTLVEEENRCVADDPSQIRALLVTAPAPQRSVFSWRDLLIEMLEGLSDPLPESKVDRSAHRDALERGLTPRLARSSEGALLRAVRAALRDRRVRLLVIDEAFALVRTGKGRLLRDQLDVLRNLVDATDARLVLVSTPRILSALQLSGELLRRTQQVSFPRYVFEDGDVRSPMQDFSRVVKTCLSLLPESVRFPVERQTLEGFYRGSLGCVRSPRAVVRPRARALRCDPRRCGLAPARVGALSRPPFSPDEALGQILDEAERGERLFARSSARTLTPARPAVPESTATPAPQRRSSAPSVSTTGRRPRVGHPRARRHRVA